MMERFHVATYNEIEKKFVIVASYDDINDVVEDYGREVLTRGTKRTMLLEQLDVNVKVDVTVLRNDSE